MTTATASVLLKEIADVCSFEDNSNEEMRLWWWCGKRCSSGRYFMTAFSSPNMTGGSLGGGGSKWYIVPDVDMTHGSRQGRITAKCCQHQLVWSTPLQLESHFTFVHVPLQKSNFKSEVGCYNWLIIEDSIYAENQVSACWADDHHSVHSYGGDDAMGILKWYITIHVRYGDSWTRCI